MNESDWQNVRRAFELLNDLYLSSTDEDFTTSVGLHEIWEASIVNGKVRIEIGIG